MKLKIFHVSAVRHQAKKISKLHKNLFFAGEIVNIDAITGGFNFQNAWTSGFITAQAITGYFS